MSADSQFGGSTDLSTIVDTNSLTLINQFLTDTVGGSVITGTIDGTTILLASGDDGQKQGAVLPDDTRTEGSMDDGALKLTLSLPPNLGFAFEGKDNATPDSVGEFLNQVIDNYLPPGTSEEARASLQSAVSDLVDSLKDAGISNVVVRMVDFLNSDSGQQSALRALGLNEVLFDAGASGGNELFALNLGHLDATKALVLKGVENALLSGSGSVRVEGTTAVRITSDGADQKITGGGGNDTLIGGGGHDTLTGGAGDDVFAFARLGHFDITDLSGGDKIAFNVAGVTSVAQLLPLVTGVTENAQGVTYHFGAEASITLVGLSAADVTADLIKFTF